MPLQPSTTPSHVLTVSQQNYGLTVEENNWDLALAYAAVSVMPNSVTSSTTTNFTSGNVLFANSGFVGSVSRSGIDTRASFPPSSHTHGNITNDGKIGTTSNLVVITSTAGLLTTNSRSGIDTRTSFPNDDVTAATSDSTAGTIVKRNSDGAISLASSNSEGVTLDIVNSGGPDTSSAKAIQVQATGTNGIAGDFISNSGTAIIATSTTGTYHAKFGTSGENRSAIERVRGWFVWFYSTFTGRLKTANITANRDWTLPDASGTIALTSDIVDSVTSATTSDGTANLSISNVTTATAILSGTGGSPYTTTLTGGINFANRTLSFPDRNGMLVTASDLANSASITASTTNVDNTIVLRDSAGQVTFGGLNISGNTAYGSATNWTYAGSTAATHRTALGLTTLATTTPAANVATFLATPSSANLAAAVTGETGTGALVFGTSPTIDAPTISGSAAFTSTTRPTSAGTGTPSATSLITATDRRTEEVADLENVYYRQLMAHELGVWVTVGVSPSGVIDGNHRSGCRFIGTTTPSSASALGGGIKYRDGNITGEAFFSLTSSVDFRFLFRNSLAATNLDVAYFVSLRSNTYFWSASSIGLYHVPQPAATWAATTAYTVGNRINVSGIVYVCSTSGTSGLTQPTFSSTINGTTNDSTAAWRTLGPHTSDKWALAFVDAFGNITLTDTGVAWVSGTINTTALRLRSNGSSVFASVNGSTEVSVSRGSLVGATPFIMCRGESATTARIAGLIWTVETSNI